MIEETEVWCSERDANADLGLDTGDIWLPLAFDWGDVLVVKEAGSNEFIGEGKATVRVGSESFIINMDYQVAVQKFKVSRGTKVIKGLTLEEEKRHSFANGSAETISAIKPVFDKMLAALRDCSQGGYNYEQRLGPIIKEAEELGL